MRGDYSKQILLIFFQCNSSLFYLLFIFVVKMVILCYPLHRRRRIIVLALPVRLSVYSCVRPSNIVRSRVNSNSENILSIKAKLYPFVYFMLNNMRKCQPTSLRYSCQRTTELCFTM